MHPTDPGLQHTTPELYNSKPRKRDRENCTTDSKPKKRTCGIKNTPRDLDPGSKNNPHDLEESTTDFRRAAVICISEGEEESAVSTGGH